jgi:hypothetical protein
MHTAWDNFFLADVSAAAALAGLIFVAVSINIDQILAFPWLPGRAGSTIAMLMGVLIMGSLALVPDQSYRRLGLEVTVVAVAIWLLLARLQITARRHPDHRNHGAPALKVLLEQIATLPAVVAGIVLLTDSSGGLSVLALSMLAVFVVAVANAWILLVEIRR